MESQELKLRKLRALRGQPNPNLQQQQGNQQQQQGQIPQNQATVTADLESIRSLFNEKEKELSMAVQKVEDLTGNIRLFQYKFLFCLYKNIVHVVYY